MWTSQTCHQDYCGPQKRSNICNPVNPDLRCALLSPSFLFENKLNTTEGGAAEVRIERITEIISLRFEYIFELNLKDSRIKFVKIESWLEFSFL